MTDEQESVMDMMRRGVPSVIAEIAMDPECSYLYAQGVVKCRWLRGEAAIATSPQFSYTYARDIIKGIWPLGEAAILTDPK